ncbi:MAG: hypothetical protein A3F13_01850 [Gammaproteobacteria bacterium RIFCSPHIGHO2_12_FULL_40_19]|nr:MAG: hypothetical protein A3F13_01850 [Gammaproteobacteria bacterium RIFCSPHIGHO2_12_FULL_40_19]
MDVNLDFDTVQTATASNHISLFWFFVILASLVGLVYFCFIQFFKYLNSSRLVTHTPHSKLRSAAQGFVKVKGIVNALFDDALLKSPLTQTPCCWYRYTIEKEIHMRDEKGNDTTEWEIVDQGQSSDLFHLKDETGECVIFPVEADVTTTAHKKWYQFGLISNELNPSNGLLEKLGSLISKTQRYRYEEHCLEPGQETIVLGFFRSCDATEDPISNYKKETHALSGEKAAKIKKKYPHLSFGGLNFLDQLTQTCDDISGQWKRFSEQKSTINLISSDQLENRPFIISDLDLKKLVAHYRWYVFGFGAGFIVSGVIAIVLIALKLAGKV